MEKSVLASIGRWYHVVPTRYHLPSKRTAHSFAFLLVGKCPEPSFLGEPKPLKREKCKMRKERHSMDSENQTTDGLKRNIQIKFRVTEAERDLIYEKMALLGTNNLAAYLRKIAIDGYIISVDTADLKAIAAECQKIGVNINQIARRVNSTTRIYEQDFDEMKRWIAEIWRLLRLSLLRAR
jgi:hypothetical protein